VAGVTWYVIIRFANGSQQRISVFADDWLNARLMIEAQFGREALSRGPPRRPHEGYLTPRHLSLD
jgi:hypothetical protein